MENFITYKAVRTNNLKGFDLSIEKGILLGVFGCSGSGKTSLVYETFYNIAQYEWNKIDASRECLDAHFEVDSYEGIIPSIAFKQINSNVNPRSTVSSFLGVDKVFRLLFASIFSKSTSIFSFNTKYGACPECEGLGTVRVIDERLLIDENRSIEQNPFRLWKEDYYEQLLLQYALKEGIPINIPFSSLSRENAKKLLVGQSEKKITFAYKKGGRRRTKSDFFVGALSFAQKLLNDKHHVSAMKTVAPYCSEQFCSCCGGQRFSPQALEYKYNGKTIGELFSLPLAELLAFLSYCCKNATKESLLIHSIIDILQPISRYGLGYIHLNRSIPSLSGGELQRLRLYSVISSRLSDVMFAVDEPSAGLHVSEYNDIIRCLNDAKEKGNTVVVIEHNPYILSHMDRLIKLGPLAGAAGGRIIEPILDEKKSFNFSKREPEDYYEFYNLCRNNVSLPCLKLPRGYITLVLGPSGSGKSSLVKALADRCQNAEYVTQRSLHGSMRSTIASYCGIFDYIRRKFAAHFSLPDSLFSFSTPNGRCPSCEGRGSILFTTDFGRQQTETQCEDCGGMRFSKTALGYKIDEKSIYDIMKMSIDELLELNFFSAGKPHDLLCLLQELGLGYLSLFRTTDSLSGGESQRLKLMRHISLKTTGKIFILDEPLRGLSLDDIPSLFNIFRRLVENRKNTLIVIEHNVAAINIADYIIEMGPGSARRGGKIVYHGIPDDFARNATSNKYIATYC